MDTAVINQCNARPEPAPPHADLLGVDQPPADQLPVDRWPPEQPPDESYDLDFLDSLYNADDADDADDADISSVQRFVDDEDMLFGDLPAMSRVDQRDWEEWAGVEQDEAERTLLELKAPAWVFLPPGAELAAALEQLRPQCESPIALIEAMKAATRMEAWAASIRTAAQASFVRQRKAQATEIPRPTQVDSSGRPIDPERSWAAEIGAALHLSAATATRHIDTALHLTGTLTATHTALRCGALTFAKALAISEATRDLPPAAAQAVEAHVLKRAPGQTHTNLNHSLRRQVAKHTTREDTDRHRDAVRDRTCKIVPLPDGMAGLWVVHTADKIQQMWTVIQAMSDLAKRGTPTTADATAAADIPATTNTTPGSAPDSTPDGASGSAPRSASGLHGDVPAQHPSTSTSGCAASPQATGSPAATGNGTEDGNGAGTVPTGEAPRPQRADPADPALDKRLAPQRRADVVADLFDHMLHNGLDWLGRRLPDQHRRRPHIEITVPITTLLGADDDPCELAGYGPVPAEMARRIATDGTWRRLLTDPANGSVLEASTTRHDPGVLVTETLLARHPVCAWPGCNRASRECDRDHGTPFARTGTTSLTGLAPFCEYHHVIKDTKAWGWSTTNYADGSVTLTAPTGHRYTTVPPARGRITQQTPPTAGAAHDPPF